MSAIGVCMACGREFSFNPDDVPSYMGDPICRCCVELVHRKAARVPDGQSRPALPDAVRREWLKQKKDEAD
jgi:hypothetical protein